MKLHFESNFDFNSIILISSTKESEHGNTRRLDEDISVIANSNSFYYHHFNVTDKRHLSGVLEKIYVLCVQEKLKPIIHLHMHGSEALGLELNPSSEYMPWDELSNHLRQINTALKNELCVFSTACHAYKVIDNISIKDVTPFFCLIAAMGEIQVGYISDNIPSFYRSLFTDDSINTAYSNISSVFSFYHCEKVLAEALIIYIMDYCKGKAKQNRKELILSKVLSHVGEDLSISLAEIRKEIKKLTKPEQDIIEKYVKNFLIGKKVDFSMEDLLKSVEVAYA
jgi:hypothetical protein